MDNDSKELLDKYLQKFYELAVFAVLIAAGFYLWRHQDYLFQLLHLKSAPEKVKVEESVQPVWQGSALVTDIIDGSTVQVQTEQYPKVIVRLGGVDAPILSRNPAYPSQSMAEESQTFLSQLIKDRAVSMCIYAVDLAKRPVVVLSLDNEPMNVEPLKNGMAELHLETLKDLPSSLRDKMEKAQADAKKHSRGIWSLANYESPTAYRIRAAHSGR